MRENAIAYITAALALTLLSQGFDGRTCRRDGGVKRSALDLPEFDG
jgi:hypothetical protein